MFIFFLLTPIKTYADQTPTPTSLEIQRATVGIQGRVLSNNNYDVLIPIDTYYRVSFNTTGGTIINDQFIKKGSYAKEPTSPTRANYEFNYWTLNTNKSSHELSEKFNFSTTPITSNMTLVAVWTPSSPSDENKPNNDKEDTNSSGDNNNEENNKDTSEDSENNESIGEDKENNTETKDEINEDNEEDSKSSDNSNDNSESNENNNGLSNTSEENTETTEESNDGLINTHTNPSSNHSKTSTPSLETDPDIATNTETTDLLSEIKATVLGVFKTISKSITIVAKISLIGILIWFIWFVVLLNNTLVKIQAPSEDQPDQPDQSKSQSQRKSKSQSKSWKTVYLTPIKKTIEQTVGDKRTVWSLSLPQNLLDDNKELKVKIPWSVYHRAEDENQANQTELHITITSDQPEPMMIYIITNETKEIKIK